MAYEFQFDQTSQVLKVTITAPINDGVLKELYAKASKIAARVHPKGGIFDFGDITETDITNDTIRFLAYSDPIIVDPSIPRVVVASECIHYGLARMFQMIGEESRPRLRVVRSMDEAYEMLGLQRPQFEVIPVGDNGRGD